VWLEAVQDGSDAFYAVGNVCDSRQAWISSSDGHAPQLMNRFGWSRSRRELPSRWELRGCLDCRLPHASTNSASSLRLTVQIPMCISPRRLPR
jgi:hypothetical protein